VGIEYPARLSFSLVLQGVPQPECLAEVLLVDTVDFPVLGAPVKSLDQQALEITLADDTRLRGLMLLDASHQAGCVLFLPD
jgi:hypothetical protein